MMQATGLLPRLAMARMLVRTAGFFAAFLFCLSLVSSAFGQPPSLKPRIRVVMDDNFPPYSFRDSTGGLQGIIIDQWHAWEKTTGVTVEIHGMDWSEAVIRMKAGEFDAIDTIFKTPDRVAFLDFSAPYATIQVPIFFRTTISGITDMASLQGFSVAVKEGDATTQMLQARGIGPLLLYKNYEAIINAAHERKVNVFVVDKPPALYFLNKRGIEGDFRMSEPISVGEFHRAVRKGNASLLRVIEKGFADVGKAEFARIEKRWFGHALSSPRYLRYLGYTALAAAAVVALLLGWSGLLARLVKKRTGALREREEQLRLYAEHSPAAIAMLDRDLKYLVVSRRWITDYRLGDQPVVGRSHYEVFPEIPQHWKAIHQRCLAGEIVKCDEEAFARADGRTDWIRWEIQPWRQADNSIGGLIMFTEDVTVRRKVTEMVREGQARLIKAFRSSPVALAIGRLSDQHLVEVNDAFSSLLGWSREEAVDHSLVELAVIDEQAEAVLRRSLDEKRSIRDLEISLRARSGATLHAIASMETIELQGEPHVVATFVDITSRKRAEASLSQVSADLGRAQLISHIGSWEYTVATDTIKWSDELYRIFGLQPQSVSLNYTLLREMVHPEDRVRHDAYRAQLTAAKPGAVIAPFEYRALRADGQIAHVLVKVEVRFDDRGDTLIQCFGTVQDITERKRAEEALRESEATFAAAFENAPIGKALVAPDGRFIRVNRVLCDIVGRTEAELLALSFQDITHQDDLGSDLEQVQKMLRHEIETFQMEKRYLHKKGGVVWVLLSVSMVNDEHGQPAFFVSQMQDITDRRKAEQRVQQLNRLYAVLSGINETIVREKSSEALLTAACRIAVEKGLFGMAWIGLLDATTGGLRIAAQVGASADTLEKLEAILSENGSSPGCAITAHALQSGGHAICNDIENDPAAVSWRADALCHHYLSMASLPLKSGGKTIGVFNLYADTAHFFDAEELKLLDELAVDIGFALDINRREMELREADKRFIKQRKTLIELTRHWGGDGDDALLLLRKIAEGAAQTLSVSRVSIWRYNSDRSAIRCVDLYEWEDGRHSSGLELSASTHPAYFRALIELEMIVADDAATDPSTSEFVDDYLRPNGIQSMLDVPIVVGGFRTGVLCLEHVRTQREWTADEKTFALAMSNLVSLALEGVERRQAETSLRESEKRFRQFAETIEEVFWMTDPSGVEMIYVSPAYEKIWHRTCASLYANPLSWLEAVHPDDRERLAAATAVKRTSGEYDERYRILRPDGTLRWIHDRAFPVRDSHGSVLRIVGTAEDITESKQVEAQLLRSQRMESIGTLAGGIAHDLNNVLTPIMMSIQLLKLQEKNARRLNILSTIETSARRGADMVQQVLSFARGVEGRQLAVQVGRLLREIEKIANETFLKNIEIRSSFENDLWVVQGDPTQLHQVLLNLCVNARDAMPGGGVLKLSACNLVLDGQCTELSTEARPGPHVLIEVEDSGVGMPPDVLERIFEPFFTTKELGKGTGLGLSTTLAIIKGHHGFMRVHSELGVGTKFQIYLPANDAGGVPEAVRPEAQLPRGSGQLVLVVDDEVTVRQIIRQTLEAFGYRVLLAADGVEASTVFTARQGEIDVVLTDMMMPVMDGLATIQVLMRMNPHVRIIAASGLSVKDMVAKATAAGVKHFIPKPYSAETLLKTLDQVLRS
ncbi:PAS domain S-box protein [Prosthecobacter sp.]|uniref:PAS domain S-box protein n=1 Tax=Prosthecobacter sp. TaxID=1965333 RepID=UPI003784D82F